MCSGRRSTADADCRTPLLRSGRGWVKKSEGSRKDWVRHGAARSDGSRGSSVSLL